MGTSKTSSILGCCNGHGTGHRNLERLDWSNADCVEATQNQSSKYDFVLSKVLKSTACDDFIVRSMFHNISLFGGI